MTTAAGKGHVTLMVTLFTLSATLQRVDIIDTRYCYATVMPLRGEWFITACATAPLEAAR